MVMANGNISAVLAAMPDGIGELTFASPEWVEAADAVLQAEVSKRAEGLADQSAFTFCEVAHNPPAYLHCGNRLAWYARFNGASVETGCGELPEAECQLKIQGDHSIISNLARIQGKGKDPKAVAAAQERLGKLSRWEIHGALPSHPVLSVVLRELHDQMATRTMPRFTFMTPEWVSTARHIVTTRAEKYADRIKDDVYTFSEEFTHTPAYAFPDGSHGGFWIHCDHGAVTVGAGPLPEALQPADTLTKGMYTPVVPVGRTVNAAMTDADKEEQTAYSAAAFRFDKEAGARPVDQTRPSGRGEMPPGLGVCMIPLHDELSKRTSSELPADFDDTIKEAWAKPNAFDRDPGYESWVCYDQFDIYGNNR